MVKALADRLAKVFTEPAPAGPQGILVLRVAEIGRDQVSDYTERKGMTLEEVEKWLSPNLAYDPDEQNGAGETEVPQARSKSVR